MRPQPNKARNVRTSVFIDKESREACRLGEKGFSTAFIAHKTGLSLCQVMYRLRLAGIRRADYRNGESAAAHKIMQEAASQELSRKIDELLNIAQAVQKFNKKHSNKDEHAKRHQGRKSSREDRKAQRKARMEVAVSSR